MEKGKSTFTLETAFLFQNVKSCSINLPIKKHDVKTFSATSFNVTGESFYNMLIVIDAASFVINHIILKTNKS